MDLEIKALNDMECFKYREKCARINDDYQWTRIHMVLDTKPDHLLKVQLVTGGHLIEFLGNEVYLSTVKGISVQILHVIAHKEKLNVLFGDVQNVYVNAETQEKVYTIAEA